MRLAVIAVGRLKDGPERDLAERYAARILPLMPPLGFRGFERHELPESRARAAAERQGAEGEAILARAGTDTLVVCDERGTAPTSTELASALAGWRDGGRAAAAFVVGGPDGLPDAVRRRAALVLSFGRLTLPHQLVRVLVLEQVYRSLTILAGHPYHRDG